MQRPSRGIECHRAELRLLVQGADVLTWPAHRHSVAWLSPHEGGRREAPDPVVTVQGSCGAERIAATAAAGGTA